MFLILGESHKHSGFPALLSSWSFLPLRMTSSLLGAPIQCLLFQEVSLMGSRWQTKITADWFNIYCCLGRSHYLRSTDRKTETRETQPLLSDGGGIDWKPALATIPSSLFFKNTLTASVTFPLCIRCPLSVPLFSAYQILCRKSALGY